MINLVNLADKARLNCRLVQMTNLDGRQMTNEYATN